MFTLKFLLRPKGRKSKENTKLLHLRQLLLLRGRKIRDKERGIKGKKRVIKEVRVRKKVAKS